MQARAAQVVFLICAVVFLFRGPYRCLSSSPGDEASNYSAGRAWVQGHDPYDHTFLNKDFHNAGGPAFLVVNQHERAFMYPASALPYFAAVSWPLWHAATVLWLLLSLGLIAGAAFLVVDDLNVTAQFKFLIGSALLVFCSPALTGLITGNPGIAATGLTILSIYAARRGSLPLSGLLLGIATSVKPQIAIVAIAAFAIWRYWRPLWIAFGIASASMLIGLARAGSVQTALLWMQHFRSTLAMASAPTGVADSSALSSSSWQMVNVEALAAIFTQNRALAHIAAWLVCGLIAAVFLTFRLRSKRPTFANDVAFLACVSLLPVYHRAYDANILLLTIPLIVQLPRKFQIPIAAALVLLGSPCERLFLSASGTVISGTSIGLGLLIHFSALVVFLLALFITAAQQSAPLAGTEPEIPRQQVSSLSLTD